MTYQAGRTPILLKRAAYAWALAALYLLPVYSDLIAPLSVMRMHSPHPLTRIVPADLTAMLFIALIIFGLVTWLRETAAWRAVRWFFLYYLLLLIGLRIHAQTSIVLGHHARALLAGAWAVLLLVAVTQFPRAAGWIIAATRVVMAALVIFAAIATIELVLAAAWRPGVQQFERPTSAASHTERPRVVWIIFDELDEQETFAQREPSVSLPNFDRLRGQSDLYTDVTPVGNFTAKAIPGLLLGFPVTETKYTWNNRMFVKPQSSRAWQSFDPSATIFGEAHRKGLHSAIVGWYIPYCPLLAGVVDRCYWDDEDIWGGTTSPSASFVQNIFFPMRIPVEQALIPRRGWANLTRWLAEAHIASTKELIAQAMQAVRSSDADLIYLHLPVPHPPPIWDRRTHQYAVGGSYLDSLSLADDVLGRLLDVLEAQPRWQETTLIVQGDHGWRAPEWTAQAGWSAEDQRVLTHLWPTGPLPVLLVHAPGQNAPGTVSSAVTLMKGREIVLSTITGSTPNR